MSAQAVTYAAPAATYAAAPAYSAYAQPTTYAAPASMSYAAVPTTYAAPAYQHQYAAAPVTYAAPAYEHQYAASPVTYAAPAYEHQYAAPAVTYAAPGSMSFAAAPAASYALPSPVSYAAAAPTTYAAPQAVTYAAPQAVTYAAPQAVTYAAPQAVTYAAPQTFAAPMQGSFVMTQPMLQPAQAMTAAGGVVGTHAYSDLNYNGAHTDEKCEDTNPMQQPNGNIHMLICGLNYECDKVSWAAHGGTKPLDHKFSFDALVEIAKLSGARYETLWNEQCQRVNILAKIGEVGRRCAPGDTFIFYFCGHGDQLPNTDPNSSTGMDQCLCTVDPEGKAGTKVDGRDAPFEDQYWTRDDQLANTILDAVSPQAKVLCLFDCCHSEGMCDFKSNKRWTAKKQRALSISAAANKEVALSDGMHGGIFTNSLTEAIEDLQKMPTYNVSTVFNRVHDEYVIHGNKDMPQHISIKGVTSRPMETAWPLQARLGGGAYVAPRRRGLVGIGKGDYVEGLEAAAAAKKKSSKKKKSGCC